MALFFNNPQKKQSNFSFQDWYSKNKEKLSQKRKARYQQDIGYREAALRRSDEQRQRRQSENIVEVGDYKFSIADAALQLGLTPWTIREWRSKDYFPEPKKIKGAMRMTQNQIELLRTLKEFFQEYGVRTSRANKEKLQSVVEMVYVNW